MRAIHRSTFDHQSLASEPERLGSRVGQSSGFPAAVVAYPTGEIITRNITRKPTKASDIWAKSKPSGKGLCFQW